MEMTIGAIERYHKDPELNFWNYDQKFKGWAKVEMAIVVAKAELHLIPRTINLLQMTASVTDLFSNKKIKRTINRITRRDAKLHHDMKAFTEIVEKALTDIQASNFHAGVTSYDIEDTWIAWCMKESIPVLLDNLKKLMRILGKIAKDYRYQTQMFRTHGVHAEPGTFGLKILNWYDEAGRQYKRLEELCNEVAIGKISGAVGTYRGINPEVEKLALSKLGLSPAKTSTQIVSRDIHARYLSTLANVASSLAKYATQIRLLQRTETLEVEEPFRKKQIGSSTLVHKRNPVRSESVCSLTRIIKVFSVVANDNQITWDERDITNSANERFILAYSTILLNHMIRTFTGVMERLNIYTDNMTRNLMKTLYLTASEEVMLALAGKGIPRRKAYIMVQKRAMEAWEKQKDFRELLLADKKVREFLTEKEIDKALKSEKHLEHIDEIYARFPELDRL